MSYLVMISEEQRLALLELLRKADAGGVSSEGSEEVPLEYWVDMLEGLPVDEKTDPGIIHGFCL